MTHDYKRNGTTTLFAALDVLESKIVGRCMQRHRHQEFIRFLNAVEAEVPKRKAVHVILDNYATHQTSQGESLVGTAQALYLPLHPDLVFVGQRGRRSPRQADPTAPQTRRLPVGRRAPGRHSPRLLPTPMARPNPSSGPNPPITSSPLSPAGAKR